MLQSYVKNWLATCPHVPVWLGASRRRTRGVIVLDEFMKHRETMMKINALSSRPMSASEDWEGAIFATGRARIASALRFAKT
jgi:hypothetical protein